MIPPLTTHSPPGAFPKPQGAYRLLHTSDWHLGKSLGDLDRMDETRRFLDFLLETVAATETDALIVAGDIFDCATPPQSAVRLYYDFLAALYSRTGCVAVVTAGNHDSPSHLESPRDLLSVLRTHIVAALSEARSEMLIPLPTADAPQLVVAAVPFLRERDLRTGRMGQGTAEIEADLRDGLRSRYAEIAEAARPWIERGVPVLAMGHLTALGAFTTADERLIHVGGLGKIGADAFPEAFAYVALGHLHRPQAVGGFEQIRYSGSPIALSFGEADDLKELRLLDFKGGQLATNLPIPIPSFRRLVQLRLPEADLEPGLRQFEPPASELPPWVEVIVEETTGTIDVYEAVQKAVAGRPFQVVKVTALRTGEIAGLELDDAAAQEDAENLLADPKAVFLRRLDREPNLQPGDRAELETAFARLYDRYLEEGTF